MRQENEAMLVYLDPVSRNEEEKSFDLAIGDLKGKTIAFLSNGWSSYDAMGEQIERALLDRYGIHRMRRYSIPTSCAPPAGLLQRVIDECDAAIVGMAN